MPQQPPERRSILCPNCRKLISRDESPCPYCGLPNPGSRLSSRFHLPNLLDPRQFITYAIILNVFMFVLSILISPTSTRLSANPLNFLSPGNASLILLGATGTIPIDRFHRWWTLISANFLHGSILHLLFNMLAFRQIAPLILQEYGVSRTTVIFLSSGVAGYLISYIAGIRFTLGASASVCGLIGAALYYGKSRGGYFGEIVYRQVAGWAVGIFIFGFLFPGINNWAHGGGLLSGLFAAFLLGYNERIRESSIHRTLAVLSSLAALGSLAWAIVSAFLILSFPGSS